jgi:hypothetical protein
MDKQKAVEKKIDEILKAAEKAGNVTAKKVIKDLANARKTVAAAVASTEWQLYHLPQFKAATERALAEFGRQFGVELGELQQASWNFGIDLVDVPLRSIGIVAAMPEIDVSALNAYREFGLDKVQGLTRSAIEKINSEISMGLMGEKSPYEVMKAVGRNLKDKGVFNSLLKRAETIVKNEAGRALEKASSDRKIAAAKVVPGLMKIWHYGHIAKMPRLDHMAAASRYAPGGDPGPIPVDQPFMVGGEALMHPRDPAGSPENTINCGCTSLFYHPRWDEMTQESQSRAA